MKTQDFLKKLEKYSTRINANTEHNESITLQVVNNVDDFFERNDIEDIDDSFFKIDAVLPKKDNLLKVFYVAGLSNDFSGC